MDNKLNYLKYKYHKSQIINSNPNISQYGGLVRSKTESVAETKADTKADTKAESEAESKSELETDPSYVQMVIQHQKNRFKELRCILTLSESTIVIIPGTGVDNFLLGTNLAKSQWTSAGFGSEYNLMMDNLKSLVKQLSDEFGSRVKFGPVGQINLNFGTPIAPPSAECIHVWGANQGNWNKSPNDKFKPTHVFGGGQASSFYKQEPGVFGIVTTIHGFSPFPPNNILKRSDTAHLGGLESSYLDQIYK